jgi:hypothetical protein
LTNKLGYANLIGTILTVVVLTGIVTAVILKIVRDRRKGKCAGCSCGCGAMEDNK